MTQNPALYPLTAAQRLMQRCIEDYQLPQTVNIGACILFKASFDSDLMQYCIQLEYERFSCLRMRFTPPDAHGKIMQYIAPFCTETGQKQLPDIPAIDLSGKSWTEALEFLEAATAAPIHEKHIWNNHFAVVSMPEGYQGIYLCIDHRTLDGCGIMILVKDILGMYLHASGSAPAPLHPQSYEKALILDMKRENDLVRQAKAYQFWSDQAAIGEPMFTGVSGHAPLLASRKKHHLPGLRAADREMVHLEEGHKTYHLDSQYAAPLLSFCEKNHVTMTSLLLMGLRTSLSYINNGEPDVSILNYISRRSVRYRSTSGGMQTHCYPVRTIMDPCTRFLDGVRKIQCLQYNIYRFADFDPAKIRQIYAEQYPIPPYGAYESAALTYQPMPARLLDHFDASMPFKGIWLSNGTTIHDLYLTVTQSCPSDGLEFFFKYQQSRLSENGADHLYKCLLKSLSLGSDQPDCTIGDILFELADCK